MLRRLGFGLLFAVLGYAAVAFISYFLVGAVSSNQHDRSVEAAMTSAFFYGPLGALAGLIGGIVFGGRKPEAPDHDGR